nr:protein PAXX [Pogona vitticeps]
MRCALAKPCPRSPPRATQLLAKGRPLLAFPVPSRPHGSLCRANRGGRPPHNAATGEGGLFLQGMVSKQDAVTDGCEFWRGDVFPDQLDGPFPEKGQDPSKDSTSKLREILARQEPTLTIQGATATVQFQTGRQGLTFDLSKAPLPEARKQLQDLMFGLVEQLQALEKCSKEGAIATNLLPLSSPEKNTLSSQILFAPGISPPKSKGGAGQTSTKKRIPGESLINPGFKSKKIPTGVDFEDP